MAAITRALSALLAHPRVERAVRPVGDRVFGTPTVLTALPAPLVPHARHRVSVVMPSYGYADYVQAAIRSAATQEGVDVEVVVVDDCGPDDSYALALQEAARHREGVVRVLRNERNLGHTRTFDAGVRAATGDFLVRLDADDLLPPGALARAVAVMEAAPSVGLVYGAVNNFSTSQPPAVGDGADAHAVVWAGGEWMRRCLQQGRNLIATPEAMLRMSVLADVGPWCVDLPHSEDLEIWLRVAAVSDVAHVEGAYQALKRDTPTNMTNTVGQAGMAFYRCHSDALDVLFETVGERLPDAARLKTTARRALADQAAEQLTHRLSRGGDPSLDAELEEFALAHGPSPRALARLRRAQRLGERARRDPLLLANAAVQGVTRDVQWAHWRATGL